METYTKKSVLLPLKQFDYLAKEHDYIEVTEWHNGEGYDIHTQDKQFSLTDGELEALQFLVLELRRRK